MYSGVVGGFERIHEALGERLAGLGVCRIGGDILQVVGIFAEIIEFLGGSFLEAEPPMHLPSGIFAVGDHPCLGWAGVDVCEGGEGVILQRFEGGFVGRISEVWGAHRPAIGCEVSDVEEVACADGALGIRQIAFTGFGDVAFAACDDVVASRVDLSVLLGEQQRNDASSGHTGGYGLVGGFEKGGGEVHEVDEVVNDAAGSDAAGPLREERDLGAEIVEIAFAAWEAGDTVVAADDDESVFSLTDCVELLEEQVQHAIQRECLAEVVAHVLADFVHVRQESGHAALKGVGVEAPKVFAGALGPFAVGVGGAEPVTERLRGLTVGEEHFEILERFSTYLSFGLFARFARGEKLSGGL